MSHGAAVELFRRFVGAKHQAAYQQAWETYRKFAAMGHENRILEDWGAGMDGYEILLEQHISTLLAYTDA